MTTKTKRRTRTRPAAARAPPMAALMKQHERTKPMEPYSKARIRMVQRLVWSSAFRSEINVNRIPKG
jgi:hypothetical protein